MIQNLSTYKYNVPWYYSFFHSFITFSCGNQQSWRWVKCHTSNNLKKWLKFGHKKVWFLLFWFWGKFKRNSGGLFCSSAMFAIGLSSKISFSWAFKSKLMIHFDYHIFFQSIYYVCCTVLEIGLDQTVQLI